MRQHFPASVVADGELAYIRGSPGRRTAFWSFWADNGGTLQAVDVPPSHKGLFLASNGGVAPLKFGATLSLGDRDENDDDDVIQAAAAEIADQDDVSRGHPLTALDTALGPGSIIGSQYQSEQQHPNQQSPSLALDTRVHKALLLHFRTAAAAATVPPAERDLLRARYAAVLSRLHSVSDPSAMAVDISWSLPPTGDPTATIHEIEEVLAAWTRTVLQARSSPPVPICEGSQAVTTLVSGKELMSELLSLYRNRFPCTLVSDMELRSMFQGNFNLATFSLARYSNRNLRLSCTKLNPPPATHARRLISLRLHELFDSL